MTSDQFLREGILDVALDGAAERPRTVRAILAGDLDNPVDDFRGERDLQLAVDQILVQLCDQKPHDSPQIVVGERFEDDELVDAVDELRIERAFDLAEHHVGDALGDFARIGRLEAQLADRHVTIETSDEATDWLAKNGFDELYGARPLARTIQEQIKKPLADDILFGRLSKGGHVKVVLKDGKLAFEFDTSAPPKAPVVDVTDEDEPQEPALAD